MESGLGGMRVFSLYCVAMMLIIALFMVAFPAHASRHSVDFHEYVVKFKVPGKVKELEYVRIDYEVQGLDKDTIVSIIPLEELAAEAKGWILDRGGLFAKFEGSNAQTTVDVTKAGIYCVAIKVATGNKDDLGQIEVNHRVDFRVNNTVVHSIAQSDGNMVYWEFVSADLKQGVNDLEFIKIGRGEVTIQEIRLYAEDPFEYGGYSGEDLIVQAGMFPGYEDVSMGFAESIEVDLSVDESVKPWTEFVFSAQIRNIGKSVWPAKGYGHVEFVIRSSGGTSDKFKLQKDLRPGESQSIGSVVKFGSVAIKAIRTKPGDELETINVDVIVHKDTFCEVVAEIEVPILRGETRMELLVGQPRIVKMQPNTIKRISRQSIGWATNIKHLADDFLIIQVPVEHSKLILGAGWTDDMNTRVIDMEVDKDLWSANTESVALDWVVEREDGVEPVLSLYHLPIRDWHLMYDVDALTEDFRQIRAAGFNTIYVQVFPQWNKDRLPIVHNSLVAARNSGLYVIPAIYFRNQGGWLETLFPGYKLRTVGNEVDALDSSLASIIADWFDIVMEDYGDVMYRTASGKIPVVVHDEYSYSGSPRMRTMGGSDEDVAAFRLWLADKYHTIIVLNEAWDVTYTSFLDVDPSVCVGKTPRDYPAPYKEWEQGILDWDQFRSEIFTRQLGQINQELKNRWTNVITGIMPFGGDNYSIVEMRGEVDEVAQRTAALGEHLRDRELSKLDFIVFIRTPVDLLDDELVGFVKYWADSGIIPILYGRVGGGYDAGSVSSLLPFYRLVYENGGVPGYFSWNDYALEENCPGYQRIESRRFIDEVKDSLK